MEKGEFLTPVVLKKVGKRLWEVYEPLVYRSRIYPGLFISPKGRLTNLASIPPFFWLLFPPVDIYDAAAIIHDGAYEGDLVTDAGQRMNVVKSVADFLFLEMLQAVGVSPGKAELMYQAVHRFGRPHSGQ